MLTLVEAVCIRQMMATSQKQEMGIAILRDDFTPKN